MWNRLLGAGLAATLFLSTPVQALTELNQPSQVAETTVYQGQAMVTRNVNLGVVNPGDYHVLVPDLPLSLIKDSVQVSGLGKATVTVHNLEVAPLPPPEEEDPRIVKLLAAIEQLERKMATLNDRQAVAKLAQEFVNTINTISQEKIQKQLSYYQIRIEHWQQLLDFIRRNQAAILEDQRNVQFDKQSFQKQTQELKEQIQKLRKENQQKTQAGHVYLTIKKGGTLILQLNYLIAGANWQPTYDARLDEKTRQLWLGYFGNVQQNTGEDWNDIKLSLSTATPILNVQVPEIQPWYIQTYQTQPTTGYRDRPAPAAKSAARDESAAGLVEKEKAEVAYTQSEIRTQGISVQFDIPQRLSIEKGHERRVPILSQSFAYTPEYHVLPRLSNLAFLKVRLKNNSKLPLLGGTIRNYVGKDYTGTSQIKLIRSNEETELSFGVDSDIKVERKLLKSQETTEGVLKDRTRKLFVYQTEISNFKNSRQTIVVFDQLPIASHEKIQVKSIKVTPKPTETLKDQAMKWKMEIEPWEKKTVYLEYYIEYPKDMTLYF